MLLMRFQVVIRAVGNAPQLTPAEREQIFNIAGALRIERQLFRRMLAEAQTFSIQPQIGQPVHAEVFPVFVPLQILARLAEEFHFHLLEFPGPENEVARRDLVAEALADLTDAKRQLAAHGALNVLEVDEHALGRFWTQVNRALCVFQNSLERFKHQVKLTDIGKVMTAAVRAGDVVFLDEIHHLFVAPALRHNLAFRRLLDQMIGAVAGLAVTAVHQRIREAL